MRFLGFLAAAMLVTLGDAAVSDGQQTIHFSTAPFAGSTALETPGRQIVGGGLLTTFDPALDVFSFETSAFGIGNSVNFANGVVGAIPASGLNIIVLQTFDNDNNAATFFGAGNAANLLATQITSSGAGVFLYFNSSLDIARLIYSADLSDETADLKVLAHLTNLSGVAGRDAFSAFTAENFQLVTTVPEPTTFAMLFAGVALIAGTRFRTRRAR